MIIGTEKLLEMVTYNDLVENLSARERNNPEGAGFDFRVGQVFDIQGRGYIDADDRKTPKLQEIMSGEYPIRYVSGIPADEQYGLKLNPGRFVIARTMEKINLPSSITAFISLRRTLYSSGIVLTGGNIAPGYSGVLQFGLKNIGPCTFLLRMGARIVHVSFIQTTDVVREYEGQWQGGQADRQDLERQV